MLREEEEMALKKKEMEEDEMEENKENQIAKEEEEEEEDEEEEEEEEEEDEDVGDVPKERLSVVYDAESDCYIVGDAAEDDDVYQLTITPTKLIFFDKIVSKETRADPKLGYGLDCDIFDTCLSSPIFTAPEKFPKQPVKIRLLANEEKLGRLFNEMPPVQYRLRPAQLADGERGGVMGRCDVSLAKFWTAYDHKLPLEVEKNFQWTKVKGKPEDDELTRAALRVKIGLTREEPDESDETTVTEDLATSARQEEETGSEAQIAVVNAGGKPKFGLWHGHADPKSRKRDVDLDRLALVEAASKERHLVRHERGRRYGALSPGFYHKTMDPENPIVITEDWRHPSELESTHDYILKQLDARVKELQHLTTRKRRRPRPPQGCDLYTQAKLQRVLVFRNGGDQYSAVFVWGRSIYDILVNATDILKLPRAARFLYDMYGKQIVDFDALHRDQLLSVSVGGPFTEPSDVRDMVEIKANWLRARRKYGPHATELGVFHGHNPVVAVDPFEPSPKVQKAFPPFIRPWKGVWVYENGREKGDGGIIFGVTLQQLLQNAMKKLKLKHYPVCFYTELGEQVNTVDQIYNEEALAVSTCGKGYIPNKTL